MPIELRGENLKVELTKLERDSLLVVASLMDRLDKEAKDTWGGKFVMYDSCDQWYATLTETGNILREWANADSLRVLRQLGTKQII